VAGAVGAWLGGPASRLRPVLLGAVLGVAFLALGAAGLLRLPAGVLLLAGYYFGYQAVLVVVSSRLQDRIDAGARATVTSVAGLAMDVTAIGCYLVWPLGQLVLMSVIGLTLAAAMPLVRTSRSGRDQL
jgi:hypothetical protein